MDARLKGLGESILILFVTIAINFLIGLVFWALGFLILYHALDARGPWPGVVLACFLAAALVALNYYSYQRVTRKVTKYEEAPRSFFELFERSEYDNLVASLKNSPTFRISHYMLITAILLAAAVLSFWLNHGYWLAPVFLVFIWYIWLTRARSIRLTAAFYSGNNLIARGRAQDAVHTAHSILKVAPRSVKGHWLMGNALFALRNYDGACQSYELAISHNPTAAKFLLAFVGLCFQRLGLYQRALRSYEEGLRLNPDAKEIHYGLACTYSLMNEPARALPHLEQAIRQGYVDRGYIGKDGDLDNIRNEPRFKELMSRLP